MSDPNAALFGVLAALAGSLHARKTGVGATYECSQIEAVASLIQTPERPRSANAKTEGIFQTLDDDFVAISIGTSPSGDWPFQSVETLEAWAGETTTQEVLSHCRGSGGLAIKVEDLALTEHSEIFAGTDVRQACLHPITGERDIVATPWRVNGHRAPIRKPAPLLGGSNEYILRNVLALSEKEIEDVHDSGVIHEDRGTYGR